VACTEEICTKLTETSKDRFGTSVPTDCLEPDHYEYHDFEPAKLWARWGMCAFSGTVLKYLFRFGKKTGTDDLSKALTFHRKAVTEAGGFDIYYPDEFEEDYENVARHYGLDALTFERFFKRPKDERAPEWLKLLFEQRLRACERSRK
jgi:hypothetical protein